ncbi:unnamed protein product [Staurois parvus]|uniref:Uncharacterized protein n=1 Tax=Staurois parvus TaxID=386267 RepID=A0ABN9CYZ9_9NEOB|nr:unnamed protein product [Staurois parvus]
MILLNPLTPIWHQIIYEGCVLLEVITVQGWTDSLETRALPEGPGVSRGPHEMPLVPFS